MDFTLWDVLLGIISWSIRILFWPLGFVIKYREFFATVIPYLVTGIVALFLSVWALGLLAMVAQAVFFVVSLIYRFFKGCFLLAYSLVAKPKLEANEESDDTAAAPPQDKSDPYYILGIDRSVTASELAARYKQLIKANHPDKVAQLDPEIQAFASERSRRIIEAYEAISAGES